jgi:membrane protein implicated in regulation of membrane protease activity
MRRFAARLAISIALLLIALVAIMIAVGYFIYALYLWLAMYLVPPAAAVVSGLIVLVLAAVLALIARMFMRGSKRRDRDYASMSAAETAAELGSLFGDKVQGFAQLNKSTSLLTALAAGFAVGVSPKLRSLLWRIIKKMT